MRHITKTYLKRIGLWGRFVGVLLTLYGLTSIVTSYLTSITYIFTGILTIILGVILFDIGREGKKLFQSEETDGRILEGLFKKYSLYLSVFGGYIIVAITYITIYFIME